MEWVAQDRLPTCGALPEDSPRRHAADLWEPGETLQEHDFQREVSHYSALAELHFSSTGAPGRSHEEKAKAEGAALTRGIQGYR